jgi:hypothetical protein
MSASVAIPLATSQRTIAVKVMDENRRIVNQHRTLLGRGKVSYTHLIGWAIVKALEEVPALNTAYVEQDGRPFRATPARINLGIAVDVSGKDGARSLMVPNIKDAGALQFQEYVNAFDDLVARARSGKIATADFQGTTISLTNPGTVGAMAPNPRLMSGQGAIVASGAIAYPAEYQGAAPETRATLGIGKVMTLTCTYDHRVIQGAESGVFLGKLLLRRDFPTSAYAAPAGALGKGPPVAVAGHDRGAHRRGRQGGRDYADDQWRKPSPCYPWCHRRGANGPEHLRTATTAPREASPTFAQCPSGLTNTDTDRTISVDMTVPTTCSDSCSSGSAPHARLIVRSRNCRQDNCA